MKKKLLTLVLCLATTISLAACGGTSESSTQKKDKKEKVDITKLDADGIINLFKDAGFPIDNIIVYTEETDVNELLGRPNQYTSKINFADTRYEQSDTENPVGGSIEVFANKNDANKRLEYVKTLAESSSLFTEYDYIYKNVLLRIHNPLTPTHAKEYEDAFNTISKGDSIKFSGESTDPVSTKETIYGLGETWTVEGSFSLAFTSVTQTDERNEYSDKTPAQVVILNYDYENIGIKDGLYISDFTVMDANGEVASTYPATITTYPQETPVGAKCVGAQEIYGLNNVSQAVKVICELYDDSYKQYTATFELAVQ